ncbi:MAG: universal stress protein [Thermodesulfovibrio sp.]|uniref:universal stress protein n=1 Tax=unclassified Thermodesulfovibrio TaxID=2645936 RepID=UPI00083A6B1B|nr:MULTISPECIES: universal stress protein [unclassified Thermodesulfovibrio]MDI1471748.1 universal stress protein [Thermodesulfovibrio sp. 1176]MDI6713639.1 universal stress protein [Thermodesulfovibrio sp.]ODA44214.1 Universal stress protein UspA [Thermodesulfovibrio sp. N1]
MLKRILVAFDGSQESYKAFDFALNLSKECSSKERKITVLSVAQPPEPADIVEIKAVIDSATEYYKKEFEKVFLVAKEHGIEVRTDIVVGHPADQIVRYATENGFDMIVIGQRGMSKIERWLLGSVSRRVATYTTCPVVIVK